MDSPKVGDEITLMAKPFLANIALILLVLGMCGQVTAQIACLRKRFIAIIYHAPKHFILISCPFVQVIKVNVLVCGNSIKGLVSLQRLTFSIRGVNAFYLEYFLRNHLTLVIFGMVLNLLKLLVNALSVCGCVFIHNFVSVLVKLEKLPALACHPHSFLTKLNVSFDLMDEN